jgi:membrane peptidoglycan carboxypeptidase
MQPARGHPKATLGRGHSSDRDRPSFHTGRTNYDLLNRVYLGEGQVGFSNASHHYFDCVPEGTTLSQRALLMGLPRNPAYYSPTKRPERALVRRNVILTAMFERGDISKADQESAESAPLPASLGSVPGTN